MSNLVNENIAAERIRYLFGLYMNGSISSAEERELAELSLVPANETLIKDLEQEYWETEPVTVLTAEESASYLSKIFGAEQAPVKSFRWWRVAVAASILLAVTLGGYFLFVNKTDKPTEITQTPLLPNDIKAPENNRAIITLADGRTVYLDSAKNGQLAVQGNVKLVKLANGQIAYQTASGEMLKEIRYNTLHNPRGSKVIDMRLADGSHVWLNAGSSVTYPVDFAGNERKVSITGEAYFEVTHDAAKPFFVSKGDMQVQVLGTHFNVNAYDDEADIKVTLFEGSVKVANATGSVLIRPHEQAIVSGKEVTVTDKVDVDAVMAWKNGLFSFNRADLKTMMKELARWYDVDVVYEGNVPAMEFGGELQRSLNLSQVLRALEKSQVRFRIEGNKIIVLK